MTKITIFLNLLVLGSLFVLTEADDQTGELMLNETMENESMMVIDPPLEITKEESLPGGCYDVEIHQCGCQPGYCTKEMCESNGRMWADGAGGTRPCPTFCDPEECTDFVLTADESEPVVQEPPLEITEEESLPGGCYDLQSHQCGCQPGYCTKKMCESNGRIWADGAGGTRGCPTFCDPEKCTDFDLTADEPAIMVQDYTPSESPTITRGGCFDAAKEECSCATDRCMMIDCEDKGFEWVSIDRCNECAPVTCRADRIAEASTAAIAPSFLVSTFVVTAAAVIATIF